MKKISMLLRVQKKVFELLLKFLAGVLHYYDHAAVAGCSRYKPSWSVSASFSLKPPKGWQ